MKVGFDIHGVIDTFGIFQDMMNKMIEDDDVEVHVISGLARAEAERRIGHIVDLSKVKYFSITDYLESRLDIEVKWIDGLPWSDETAWNNAKANYCQDEGIDVLFDDSPVYGKTFDNIATVYCQVRNPNRKTYKTR
ncbi:hypothetical protein LCGC14_2389350 [marine sediment metagenome]|uniref:Uncharacterized protein n=1 Tax=marine sediment metagenome TaxID=412755 RepID=A0A0F9ET51_9ZZZZ